MDHREATPCLHCDGGKKTFKTTKEHPRGAGLVVPCSRCHGSEVEKTGVQAPVSSPA